MKQLYKFLPVKAVAPHHEDAVTNESVLQGLAPTAHPPVQDMISQSAGSDRAMLASVLSKTATVAARAKQRQAYDSDFAWTLPGFGGKCRVSTIFGELPIEALRRRDKVKTRSGAYREVQWVDQIKLDEDFMARHPEAHPVLISARAFGGPQPQQNMLVSSGQPLGSIKMMGDKKPKTVADLEGQPNIARMRQPRFTYYRFHCGTSEAVMIEGAWFTVAP